MVLSVQAGSSVADLTNAAAKLQAAFGAAAQYLGVRPNELRTELASGKSLEEIATARGKTVDGLRTAVLDAAGVRPGSPLARPIERLLRAHAGRHPHHGHGVPSTPELVPADQGSGAGDSVPRLSVRA